MILRSLVNHAEQTLTEARRGGHYAGAETENTRSHLSYCCSSTIVPDVEDFEISLSQPIWR